MTAFRHGNRIKYPEPFYLSPSDSSERALDTSGHVVLRAGGVVQHILAHEFETTLGATDGLLDARHEVLRLEEEVAVMREGVGLATRQLAEIAADRISRAPADSPVNVLDAVGQMPGQTIGIIAGALHLNAQAVILELEQLVAAGFLERQEDEGVVTFRLAE